MIGTRQLFLFLTVILLMDLTTPLSGFAQSPRKRAQDAASSKSSDTNAADPTPQELFAGFLQSNGSGISRVSSIPTGPGLGPRSLTRAESLAATATASKPSKTQSPAVGPRGFTLREAKLVTRETQLLDRQTVLMARLEKLEATVTAKAVGPTSNQVHAAEASVVAQLNANEVAISKTLATLSSMPNASPALKSEVSMLSAQAQSIDYQAGQLVAKGGFPTGDLYPATASK